MAYDANLAKDLSTSTPTEGSSYIPELNDAVREIKRVITYNEGVTAVSSYPYTVAVTDTTLYCTGAGGTVAAPQLSTVSTTAYQKRVVVINDSAGSVTFDAYSTETVGGSLTYTVVAGAIAEFLAHGGTDWEVVRDTGKVWDGTAMRSFSATPAANTVPVRNANADLGDRNNNVLWGMTGEASTAAATLTTKTIDVGSVKNGDRIFIEAMVTWIPTSAGVHGIYIQKSSGTATVEFVHQETALYQTTYITTTGSSIVQSILGICKITGDGTLILGSGLSYAGTPTMFGNHAFHVLFLKKQ